MSPSVPLNDDDVAGVTGVSTLRPMLSNDCWGREKVTLELLKLPLLQENSLYHSTALIFLDEDDSFHSLRRVRAVGREEAASSWSLVGCDGAASRRNGW